MNLTKEATKKQDEPQDIKRQDMTKENKKIKTNWE